jgi:N-dimethylarginine dimethylaminohydrolase
MEPGMTGEFGCRDMTGRLRRVLVRQPDPAACRLWREYGWRSEPELPGLLREHETLCDLLEQTGAEVVVAEPLDDDPDSIYTFDPALATEHGAILLRPGKAGRRGEPDAAGAALEAAGVPVAARLEEPALAEGGDFIRLDERTMLAGRGYRTNSDGIWSIERLLPGVEMLVFDLPHWHGEDEVMHLLSLLSPVDRDLAVGYPPLMPVRLAQLLRERDIELIEVPDDEFDTMGSNVLALAPRVALMLEHNRETRRRLEQAGVEVLVYEGKELSKGDGGPTCLTLPLSRE